MRKKKNTDLKFHVFEMIHGTYDHGYTPDLSVIIIMGATTSKEAATSACKHISKKTGIPATLSYADDRSCVIYRPVSPEPMIFTILEDIKTPFDVIMQTANLKEAALVATHNNRSLLITESDLGSEYNHSANEWDPVPFIASFNELSSEQKLYILNKLNDPSTKNGEQLIPYKPFGEGVPEFDVLMYIFALKTS